MALDYTKKKRRRGPDFLDVIHIALAVATAVLFVIVMIDNEKNIKIFPAVFFTAALLNLFDAIYQIKHLPHGKKNFVGIILSFILTLIMLAIGLWTIVPIYF